MDDDGAINASKAGRVPQPPAADLQAGRSEGVSATSVTVRVGRRSCPHRPKYSARGRYILSEQYEEVVRQTPHVKQQVPAWLWGVLALAIVGSAAVLAHALR